MGLARDMQIIANNVANMSTPGFRGQNLVFEEYLEDSDGVENDLSFVENRGQYELTSPGPLNSTNNPLTIALNGPGFIGIQGEGGETVYTRDGEFTLDATGRLMTMGGLGVASDGGGDITIPQGSTEIKIDGKGVVSNQDGPVGQIMVVEFEDLQSLTPLGNNTYSTDDAAIDPANTEVKQGYLEGSNVNAVLEMSRMIETLRSYQSLQNAMQGEHERMLTAIQKLTSSS